MRIVLSLLASLIVSPLLHAQQVPPTSNQPIFNQATFNKNAAQYGNKAANLIELENIARDLRDNQHLRVFIPAIFPISHEKMAAYVQAKLGDFIQKAWNDFKASQPANEKVLTGKARTVLEHIRTEIMEAFNTPLALSHERGKKLTDFLTQAKDKQALLMVRSTGKEDTATLANAGGNESIPSVKPELADISTAIGRVIASYFSEKSMSQRLLAGDKTIFDAPFMPVLLQVMIGEPANNKDAKKIPVSGVMFSQEAEGHTPDVVQVQATYGHGEAVVNGLLPVDTFYIGPSDIIHPVIRIKKDRLATVKDNRHFKLDYQQNPNGFSHRQCLSNALVLALKQTAQEVQRYYENHPMDIEFVVQNDTIYLVQARPIVEQKIQASFLGQEFVQSLAPENILRIDVIGAGGGAVREITAKDQVIVSDNIRDALELFLKNPEPDRIKGIAVSEMAPATSHEATTFRGANKPVVYVKDLGQLRQWLDDSRLMVDAQRGIIVQLMAGQKPVIDQGWFSHPIPALMSLMPDNIQKLSKEDLDALKPHEFFPGKSLRMLIEVVKNESANEALKALRSILSRIGAAVAAEEKKAASSDQTTLKQLKAIFMHVLTAAHEAIQAMQDINRLSRLYPLRFIEALMYQWPQPLEIINNYSLGALLKIEKEEKEIKEALPVDASQYAVQFAKLTPFALTDSVAKDWKAFIARIAPDDRPKLATLIKDLIELDLAPLWINTSFAFAWKLTSGKAQETGTKLLTEQEQIKDFLQQLQGYKKHINDLLIPQWEDPGKFKSQVQQLDSILRFFTNDAFKTAYEKTTDLGKNAALAVMTLLVDHFDTSIKALEASQKYTKIDEKIRNFEQLLQRYLRLLEALVGLLSEQNQESFVPQTVNVYVSAINDLIKNAAKAPATLLPSGHVNVAVGALGSPGNWMQGIGIGPYQRYSPTLEDAFSLIHQSLLNTLAFLTSKTNLQRIDVPEIIRAVQNIISQDIDLTGYSTHPDLIGITLHREKLEYYYKIPLRAHGGMIRLVYDYKNKNVSLYIKFVGPGGNRWAFIYFIAFLSQKSGFIFQPQQDPIMDRHHVTFAWNLGSDTRNMQRLPIHNYITLCSLITFGTGTYGINVHEFLQERMFNNNASVTNKAIFETFQLNKIYTKPEIDEIAPELFGHLVAHNYEEAYKDAIASAQRLVETGDQDTQHKALNLFKALVEKGQGFNEAIAAAEFNLIHPSDEIRDATLNLFKALFEKGQGFDKAIHIAQLYIGSPFYSESRSAALNLFKALFEQQQGFDVAASFIASAIKSDKLTNEGRQLFAELNSSPHPDAKKAVDKLKADLKDAKPSSSGAQQLLTIINQS